MKDPYNQLDLWYVCSPQPRVGDGAIHDDSRGTADAECSLFAGESLARERFDVQTESGRASPSALAGSRDCCTRLRCNEHQRTYGGRHGTQAPWHPGSGYLGTWCTRTAAVRAAVTSICSATQRIGSNGGTAQTCAWYKDP